MRLGMTLGMTGTIDMALVLEAERLGFTMVWCGESYGSDNDGYYTEDDDEKPNLLGRIILFFRSLWKSRMKE